MYTYEDSAAPTRATRYKTLFCPLITSDPTTPRIGESTFRSKRRRGRRQRTENQGRREKKKERTERRGNENKGKRENKGMKYYNKRYKAKSP